MAAGFIIGFLWGGFSQAGQETNYLQAVVEGIVSGFAGDAVVTLARACGPALLRMVGLGGGSAASNPQNQQKAQQAVQQALPRVTQATQRAAPQLAQEEAALAPRIAQAEEVAQAEVDAALRSVPRHYAKMPGPVYESFAKANGVAENSVQALEYVGPTKNPDWFNAGHTEAFTGWLTTFEEWATSFYSPSTKLWSLAHYSSRNETMPNGPP
jgi:hypothetical protein